MIYCQEGQASCSAAVLESQIAKSQHIIATQFELLTITQNSLHGSLSSRSCGSGVGSQQRFRVFLVGRGGREGRALDETRLVAVVVVVLLLLFVVIVVGIFLMKKFSKLTDWLQKKYFQMRGRKHGKQKLPIFPHSTLSRGGEG